MQSSRQEIFAEATAVYENDVEAVESGIFETLQAYARNLSEHIIPRGVETHEVTGIVLLVRDVGQRTPLAWASSKNVSALSGQTILCRVIREALSQLVAKTPRFPS